MSYGKILAQNMRRIRREKGFSQDELGEQCGLSRNYIGNLERQEYSPSLDAMAAIADALGVSLIELLTKTDPN